MTAELARRSMASSARYRQVIARRQESVFAPAARFRESVTGRTVAQAHQQNHHSSSMRSYARSAVTSGKATFRQQRADVRTEDLNDVAVVRHVTGERTVAWNGAVGDGNRVPRRAAALWLTSHKPLLDRRQTAEVAWSPLNIIATNIRHVTDRGDEPAPD